MIPAAVKRELLSIGESGEPPVTGLLANPDVAWRCLLCGNEPWEALAGTLNEADLRNTIRGLVLLSHVSGFSGGSVSPVIVLYRTYVGRWPDHESELTGWIVDNRRNDYEPFGTINHGKARNLAELEEFRRRCAEVRAANVARDAEPQRLDALAKAAHATTRVAGAVRRGDVAALEALIRTGADLGTALSPGESLVELARTNGRERMVAFLRDAGLE